MTPASLISPAMSRQADGEIHPQCLPSSNAQLQQLVTASGLSSAVAMTIFNRGLGTSACSESQWKGYLAEPDSPRYLELSAEQLAHGIHQFARIGVHRDLDDAI
ncbi:hypothetical protein BH11PSE10_BH11PSE10_12210 [soil metagenome]